MNRPRVAMLATDCDSTWYIYNALSRAFDVVGVILEPPIPRLDFLKMRARRYGWRAAAGQAAFRLAIMPRLSRAGRARVRAIEAEHGLDPTPAPPGKIRHVPSVNDPITLTQIADLAPAALVLSGTRIVGKKLLSSVGMPVVNMHAGITPLYRGVHGGYWALVEDDAKNFGVTVHLVDPGIDTGGILAQRFARPTPADNFATYPVLQCAVGVPALVDAVGDVIAGRAQVIAPPPGTSKLRVHPTLAEYAYNRLARGVR